jgi:hypothetical protein
VIPPRQIEKACWHMPHDKGPSRAQMTANEAAIRKACQVAEDKDIAGRANCFTTEGTFHDESIEIAYRGQEPGRTVEVYATAFPDMHREP